MYLYRSGRLQGGCAGGLSLHAALRLSLTPLFVSERHTERTPHLANGQRPRWPAMLASRPAEYHDAELLGRSASGDSSMEGTGLSRLRAQQHANEMEADAREIREWPEPSSSSSSSDSGGTSRFSDGSVGDGRDTAFCALDDTSIGGTVLSPLCAAAPASPPVDRDEADAREIREWYREQQALDEASGLYASRSRRPPCSHDDCCLLLRCRQIFSCRL